MNEIMRNRESLSPQQVFDLYYSTSHIDRTLVVELLNHVAAELSLPADKLRPGDRFSVELAPKKDAAWDSGYGVLLFELKRLAKKKNKKIERRITTLDDYLRAMAEVY